ncbi:MAG: tyrosine-type recombinase/integrase [Gammaproteobacteria bacterium]|nr:tyrosine-type recombinase/integrase [Gammaproteobacteria bacterium]
MALTDKAIKNAKIRDRTYRLYDDHGLHLEVSPQGGKWWRLKYRLDGWEKRLSLETYPDVGLADAREKREALRKQVAAKVDPSGVRKDAKAARDHTFEKIGREYIEARKRKWAPRTPNLVTGRLEELFKRLGTRPVSLISVTELRHALEQVQARGAIETAHRIRQDASLVFRFAMGKGLADHDPAAGLRGVLEERQTKHHAAITDPKEIGALLRAIDGFSGEPATKATLRLAPLVFVRPGELRAGEWQEFDFDAAEWRIPAARVKMRAPHVVPLSRQAIEILRALQPITGQRAHLAQGTPNYVFPGVRTRARCLSENTINASLRRLGYTPDQMTGHGFRSMASTRLNESQKWHRDAIERQLAHGERDRVRASYNHAEHLPERRRMMQW